MVTISLRRANIVPLALYGPVIIDIKVPPSNNRLSRFKILFKDKMRRDTNVS